MAVNITAKEIFCVPVKDLLRSVQTFAFEEMSSAVKAIIVIIKDCPYPFTANLAVHEYYDEEAATMSTSPNDTTSSELTPEPDARPVMSLFLQQLKMKEHIWRVRSRRISNTIMNLLMIR